MALLTPFTIYSVLLKTSSVKYREIQSVNQSHTNHEWPVRGNMCGRVRPTSQPHKCWFRSFLLGHPQPEGDSSVKSQGKWTINPVYSGTTASQVASSGKEPTCQYRRCKRHGFDHWVRKMPWRRAWQPVQDSCKLPASTIKSVRGMSRPPLLR